MTNPDIPESASIETETLFESPGGWITVIRKVGSPFTWSERKHRNSVGILAIRHTDNGLEVLAHSEHNPAHYEFRDINWGVCGGRMDKEHPPIEIAKAELREEGGYDCPVDKITPVGKIFCTTQSSEHVFLFVADVTGLPYLGMQLEAEEGDYGHDNKWLDLNAALELSEDPRFIVALERYTRKIAL